MILTCIYSRLLACVESSTGSICCYRKNLAMQVPDNCSVVVTKIAFPEKRFFAKGFTLITYYALLPFKSILPPNKHISITFVNILTIVGKLLRISGVLMQSHTTSMLSCKLSFAGAILLLAGRQYCFCPQLTERNQIAHVLMHSSFSEHAALRGNI